MEFCRCTNCSNADNNNGDSPVQGEVQEGSTLVWVESKNRWFSFDSKMVVKLEQDVVQQEDDVDPATQVRDHAVAARDIKLTMSTADYTSATAFSTGTNFSRTDYFTVKYELKGPEYTVDGVQLVEGDRYESEPNEDPEYPEYLVEERSYAEHLYSSEDDRTFTWEPQEAVKLADISLLALPDVLSSRIHRKRGVYRIDLEPSQAPKSMKRLDAEQMARLFPEYVASDRYVLNDIRAFAWYG